MAHVFVEAGKVKFSEQAKRPEAQKKRLLLLKFKRPSTGRLSSSARRKSVTFLSRLRLVD